MLLLMIIYMLARARVCVCVCTLFFNGTVIKMRMDRDRLVGGGEGAERGRERGRFG
jgi:hypothetical protein